MDAKGHSSDDVKLFCRPEEKIKYLSNKLLEKFEILIIKKISILKLFHNYVGLKYAWLYIVFYFLFYLSHYVYLYNNNCFNNYYSLFRNIWKANLVRDKKSVQKTKNGNVCLYIIVSCIMWRARQIRPACHVGHACHRFATPDVGVCLMYCHCCLYFMTKLCCEHWLDQVTYLNC